MSGTKAIMTRVEKIPIELWTVAALVFYFLNLDNIIREASLGFAILAGLSMWIEIGRQICHQKTEDQKEQLREERSSRS